MDIRLRNMTSVYFVREDGVLCLYRIGSRVVSNKYVGSAGGHFEPGELNDPKACILREMEEELGLKEEDTEGLALRYVTHRLMGSEIRQNYYFFAGLKTERALESKEGDLRWVAWNEVADLPMPVSAKHMILHYMTEGRHTDWVYCGVTEENGTNFVILQDFQG